MEEWMAAVGAHVHVRYLTERHITSDLWDRGSVGVQFFMMPWGDVGGQPRKPLAIRSLPDDDGPRRRDGIFPGEVVEVVQVIERPMDEHAPAQRFLRLADDRGWVFDWHPQMDFQVLVPVPGVYKECKAQMYTYSHYCTQPLQTFSTPNCDPLSDAAQPIDSTYSTNTGFPPGADLHVQAVWTTSAKALGLLGEVGAGAGAGAEMGAEAEVGVGVEADRPVVLLRLVGGGWAAQYDTMTNECLLQEVGAKPTRARIVKDKPKPSPAQAQAQAAKAAKAAKQAKTQAKADPGPIKPRKIADANPSS
ncbi:hypothetical protein B484DRAFT_454835 [Ochromonadaceae sp. CCMP2298]|nr:hypothetical protein B484DRAFT_454835 [Ochromonadaceae sp. CCMP2298]